jgi:hypothetical protein
VLDNGGRNDVFCTALRANGFPVAVTHDPMVPEYARRPDGKFDLVTCFETLEHLPDPTAGVSQIVGCVALSCSQRSCCQRTSTLSASTGGTLGRATATSRSSAEGRLLQLGIDTAISWYRSTTISISHFAPCHRS